MKTHGPLTELTPSTMPSSTPIQLGLDHVRRHFQRDFPVDGPAAAGDSRVAVPDADVIAEEPCPLGAGVRDEGLGLVEFQSEGLPEERGQPGLDLLGFGLRPDESQYVIVGVPQVLEAPVSGVHRVVMGKRAQLFLQVAGCRPVSARPRASHPALHPRVFGLSLRRAPRVYCGISSCSTNLWSLSR